MSNHAHWAVKPWEWQDVPLAWQDWVLISIDVHNNLNAAPDKAGYG